MDKIRLFEGYYLPAGEENGDKVTLLLCSWVVTVRVVARKENFV
jgi:hypothetical protein